MIITLGIYVRSVQSIEGDSGAAIHELIEHLLNLLQPSCSGLDQSTLECHGSPGVTRGRGDLKINVVQSC